MKFEGILAGAARISVTGGRYEKLEEIKQIAGDQCDIRIDSTTPE
jgi:hypothetical protein